MCGIFGVLLGKETGYSSALLINTVDHLFVLSGSRGKEAAGCAIRSEGRLNVYKEPGSARYFIRRRGYRQLLKEVISDTVKCKYTTLINKPIAIIGHTRLATNGSEADNNNNNPIISNGVVGVHNGIVVNDDALWKKFPSLKRKGLVDSTIIFSLLDLFYKEGLSLPASVKAIFKNIEGSASIAAFISDCDDLVLATNTGSLYFCRNVVGNVHIFASELPILQRLIKKLRLERVIGKYAISQLKPKQGTLINIHELTEQKFNLDLQNNHRITTIE